MAGHRTEEERIFLDRYIGSLAFSEEVLEAKNKIHWRSGELEIDGELQIDGIVRLGKVNAFNNGDLDSPVYDSGGFTKEMYYRTTEGYWITTRNANTAGLEYDPKTNTFIVEYDPDTDICLSLY